MKYDVKKNKDQSLLKFERKFSKLKKIKIQIRIGFRWNELKIQGFKTRIR